MDRQLPSQAKRPSTPGMAARGHTGYAAVMALLFMAMIATMAAGLYSLVQSSTAISSNERQVAKALGATETGIEFFRYQTNQAVKSVTTPFRGANAEAWLTALQDNLRTTLADSNGVDSASIAYIRANNGIPAHVDIASPISVGADASFTGMVTTDSTGSCLLLVVTGASGSVTRTAQVGLTITSGGNYGPMMFPMLAGVDILKTWNVTPDGQTKEKQYGTVTPLTMADGTTVDALLYPDRTVPPTPPAFPNNDALIAAVAGIGLKSIDDPSTRTTTSTFFPATYNKKGELVTNPYTVTTVVAQNSCYIPAGTNPTLTGTINGIIYVQWPNNVILGGNLTLNGTIVMERKGEKSGTSTITLSRDGVIQRSMDAANTEIMKLSFPGNEQMKWWTLIAPDADFVLGNGTVWDTNKAFEGSLHFNSVNREGGGNDPGFKITKGGMLAEKTINFTSNGASYTIDADASGVEGAEHVDGRATLEWSTYDEPLPQN